MTDLELKRLQRGQTLQNKIEKIKSQIKSLEDVTYIMLGTICFTIKRRTK